MREAIRSRGRDALPPMLPHVPLLEAADLPDDDWTLPSVGGDDGAGDEDRYATLNVACSFDD
jgi:hypothetical protein